MLPFRGFCRPARNTLTTPMAFLVQDQGPSLSRDLVDKRTSLLPAALVESIIFFKLILYPTNILESCFSLNTFNTGECLMCYTLIIAFTNDGIFPCS